MFSKKVKKKNFRGDIPNAMSEENLLLSVVKNLKKEIGIERKNMSGIYASKERKNISFIFLLPLSIASRSSICDKTKLVMKVIMREKEITLFITNLNRVFIF
jgi:hypothetical protein